MAPSSAAAATPEPDHPPEATSLLGRPLYLPEIPPDRRARLEEALAQAQADYDKNPRDPDALIWLGRRTAYLARYRDAIALFTRGLERHPDDPRFYRHRGHRFLTLRQLDRAITDFEAAARLVAGQPDEIEPDGLPNPQNLPRSTLQSNIWYHLGLAHYAQGDFARARQAYLECLKVSTNDDMLVATANWLYLTLRRRGRDAEAAALLERIHLEMDIIENHAYRTLLLMHKGAQAPEAVLASAGDDPLARATLGYGVAAYYLLNGETEKANALFDEILRLPEWAAFGYLAAEAELARPHPPSH